MRHVHSEFLCLFYDKILRWFKIYYLYKADNVNWMEILSGEILRLHGSSIMA